MSSKSLNKKSDNKNDKAEQEALKEVEIIAELAPNEKTRKEAEKLIETVENESTTSLQETKSNPQSNSIAQDSSEIFDSYKQGVLKVTEELSKFQPNYAESISKLQEEYIQLTKEFVNKVFAAQRNFAGSNVTSTSTTFPTSTYAPYAEQFRRQSNEITAQALSVFDISNQLAINAINAARENVKLYGKAIDAMMEFNNNVANQWSSFFTSAQRLQYFRQ
ncbi:MAG: hypothetical protein ACHQXG_07090 [Nitrososphaerales archaeon]